MRRRTAIIVVLLLVSGANLNVAVASTTSGDRQEFDVELLREAAEVHFREFGHYPSTDSAGTWFEKLVELNIISPDGLLCGTTGDGRLAVDLYGQLLVYEVLNSQ